MPFFFQDWCAFFLCFVLCDDYPPGNDLTYPTKREFRKIIISKSAFKRGYVRSQEGYHIIPYPNFPPGFHPPPHQKKSGSPLMNLRLEFSGQRCLVPDIQYRHQILVSNGVSMWNRRSLCSKAPTLLYQSEVPKKEIQKTLGNYRKTAWPKARCLSTPPPPKKQLNHVLYFSH